jgi:acyl-CoA reductase-like NAD-dependent aldehyde dehydrogenase
MPTFDVTNPATGQRLARIPADDTAGIRRKVGAARAAQPAWAETPWSAKKAIFQQFRQLLEAATEPLARLLTSEMGKPIQQSRSELKGLLPRLDFFLAETPRVLRTETVHHDAETSTTERITADPLGLVTNISAWNYPYFVGGNVLLPALLTGNSVLYKPSELVPQTGAAFAELLHQAGVPADALAVVQGGGRTGSLLLRQPLDGVFFTGSRATGRRIAQAAARHLIKVQLELGGKDPVYVCADVDVAQAAASLADGAFYNTGQSCCSVERIYVHRKIWRSFLDAFVATVRQFKVGDPNDEDTYIGPLARPAQRAVLESQVADARAQGARVVLGGKRLRRRGSYFAPTVLTHVTHGMSVMRDESFGPIIGLMPVDHDEAAIHLMNDTIYGLTAGVYSTDGDRAERILRQVNAGSAYWNCCDRVSPRLPWSGRQGSGLGLTLSREGIRTFTQPKAWHLRASGAS